MKKMVLFAVAAILAVTAVMPVVSAQSENAVWLDDDLNSLVNVETSCDPPIKDWVRCVVASLRNLGDYICETYVDSRGCPPYHCGPLLPILDWIRCQLGFSGGSIDLDKLFAAQFT